MGLQRMSTDLQKRESAELRYGYTDEQVSVIKATIAPGASNDELALFLTVAQKTGLDPFSRQIYLSERRSYDKDTNQWTIKKTPETTIDGFRVIAERSGQYAGQVGPFWCGDDGVWHDVWLDRTKMPTAAKVGILRHDFKEPVWGIALFEEYVQFKKDGTPNSMWTKMGANQIAKCAEALGLRKAFPRDLSGMYSREEMAQADERTAKIAPMEVAQRQIEANNQKRVAEGKPPITEANPVVPDSEKWEPLIPPPDYEQRHAALIMEANEVLEAPPAPKPERKRGAISFAALKKWGEAKKQILAATGTMDLYYKALRAGGYGHADEIRTAEEAKIIWKALQDVIKEFTAAKNDETLQSEVERHWTRLGDKKFLAILGANGFVDIKEFIDNANGAQTDAFLRELREAE